MLRQLAAGTGGAANLPNTVLLALGGAWFLHCLPDRWYDGLRELFIRLPALVQGLVLTLVAVVVFKVAQSDVVPYIYFQF